MMHGPVNIKFGDNNVMIYEIPKVKATCISGENS